MGDGLSLLISLLPVGCQPFSANFKSLFSFISNLEGRHWDGWCRSGGGEDSNRGSGDGGCRHYRYVGDVGGGGGRGDSGR